MITPIPDIVRGLNAVAVALVSRGGALQDANRGFLLVLKDIAPDHDGGRIGDLFAEPAFSDLLCRTPSSVEMLIYEGVLRLRGIKDRLVPLKGRIFADDAELLLVAEHDTSELATLREKLLQAGDEVAAAERTIIRLERELHQATELAAAALRDRDTLIEALSSSPS